MLTILLASSALSISEAVRGLVQATLLILSGAVLLARPSFAEGAGKPATAAREPCRLTRSGDLAAAAVQEPGPQEPCCPRHAEDPEGAAFQARLAGLLEEAGRGASEELLDVVRAALRNRQQLPSMYLGELLLRGYLAHDLRDEFDELYAEMCPGGVVPTIKMLALRRMW